MNKLMSMSVYLGMGIFFVVCAHGTEDKAVELLFVILATVWVMFGILMDKLYSLEKQL